MAETLSVPALELEPQDTGQIESREFIEATTGPEVRFESCRQRDGGRGRDRG